MAPLVHSRFDKYHWSKCTRKQMRENIMCVQLFYTYTVDSLSVSQTSPYFEQNARTLGHLSSP